VGPEEAAVLVLGALLALAHAPTGARVPGRLPERVWAALETLLRGRARPAAARRLRPLPPAARSASTR
jgi:hypothetical protein